MKIVITGSLGHIGKPLTTTLIQKGHDVTVISSRSEKQKEIGALGATASIGQLQDPDFLSKTFQHADAVYLMIPPNYIGVDDLRAYYSQIGESYAKAIRQTGVHRVVFLSSIGANLDKGTGVVLGVHDVENILNNLPNIALTHLRPGYFYYNLYNYTGMIRGLGSIVDNFGGEDKIVMVSPDDIAAAAAEELLQKDHVQRIRYIASDERTAAGIAKAIGAAIGMPDLQWKTCTDEQSLEGLLQHGVPKPFATSLVEMNASLHSGLFYQGYQQPPSMGKVKLEDFLVEYAAAYKK